MTARSDDPVTHTGNSTQARMIEAAAADVESVRGIRDMYRDAGWTEHATEAEAWLEVAQQDHVAAVAQAEAMSEMHGPATATDRDVASANPGDASAQQAAEAAVGGFVAASRSASHTQADREAGQ